MEITNSMEDDNKEIEMPKAHNYGADYLSLMAAICNFIVPMLVSWRFTPAAL